MKFFKKGGGIFAFEEDGSQDDFITDDMIEVSEIEADVIRYPKQSIHKKREVMHCKAWQIRRALTAIGVRDAVELVISQADRDTRDMWDFAMSYKRTHPIVLSTAASLNKTDEEIDDLFRLALSYTE